MKKNHGKFAFFQMLFLILPLLLFAKADFKYELHLNKHTAFVNEPILLTFKVWQTNPEKIMFFEFAPVEDKLAFKLKPLRQKNNTFEYLIFPKKPGETLLNLFFLVKRTSEERLATNNTGEPVKAKAIDTTDTREVIKPLKLNIKPLPKKVSLTGDYELKVSIDKNQTEVQSPIYLSYTHFKRSWCIT